MSFEDNPLGCLAAVGAVVVLGGVALTSGCGALNNYQYSDGVRIGVINKFSKKGTFWKTYEGELVLEGIVSNGQSSGANLWDFSLDNQARHGESVEDLARTIRNCAEGSVKVKIRYNEPWTSWPWRGGTNYLVQSVEPLSQVQQKTQSKLDLVKQVADANSDGRVSPQEWARVYEALGIEFDPMSPRKLGDEDFDRYLAAHKRVPR